MDKKYYITDNADTDVGLWDEVEATFNFFDTREDAVKAAKEGVNCGKYQWFVVEATITDVVTRGIARVKKVVK